MTWVAFFILIVMWGYPHFLHAKICEIVGFTLKALWISLELNLWNTWSVMTGSGWEMPMFADTVDTKGVTRSPWWIIAYIVAQIASFSISAVHLPMLLLMSNGRLDNTSTSLFVFCEWYFIFKSKSANSATHGYPTAGSLVDVSGLLSL